MSKLVDLTGRRFGRLTVIERAGTYKSESDSFQSFATWRCKCDCGKETVVISVNLLHGATRSCGCLRAEKSKERMEKYRDYRFRAANGI